MEPKTDLEWFKSLKVTKKPTGSSGPAALLATDEEPKPETTPEEEVRQELINHPEISGATLLNVIHSKGYKITKEADASSSNVSALRGFAERLRPALEKKKSSVHEVTESSSPRLSGNLTFRTRFIEAAASDNGIGHTRFRVVLIQEGLGNLKDAYYYSREALESAVSVFEGKKIYADHPTSVEEQTRPERSVKDVLGHFEGVRLSEGEDGRAYLEAEVVILPDEPYRWARALMRHSVEYAKKYPDKDFVGLSINASGEAEPMSLEALVERGVPESAKTKLDQARREGIEQIKFVSSINEAVSCDLVTEAGAGGRVLAMLEKEKNIMAKKKSDKEVEIKESKEAMPEAMEQAPVEAPHDDEAQDIALFKKLIAEVFGEEMMDESQVMEMCKEAYDAYLEMGYKVDEALMAATHAMKLAKHLASKKEAKAEEQVAKHVDVIVDGEHEVEKPEEEEKKEETKESETILKLNAEISALKETLRKIEIEKHLENVLKESGLPRSVTSVFKENLKSPKSTAEIDEKFKLFVETYRAAQGSATDGLPFIVSTEKREQTGKGAITFADCLN